MPGRKTTKVALAVLTAMPPIPKDIIDQFVTGPMCAESVQNISLAFKKAPIADRARPWRRDVAPRSSSPWCR